MQETPGDEIEPTSEREANQKVPWLRRPRATFWDSVPSLRILQAAWALPYISLGLAIGGRVGNPRSVDVTLLLLCSFVALAETAFLVAWLRRPAVKDDRRLKRILSMRHPNRDA